jgi:hypothetical protein
VVDMKPEFTAGFSWNKGRYELNIKFANGDVFPLMSGTIFCDRKL